MATRDSHVPCNQAHKQNKPVLASTTSGGIIQEPYEPKQSWLILFFVVMPYAAVLGTDFISFGFYYVEYCNFFNANKAIVGTIGGCKMTGYFGWCGVSSVLLNLYGCRFVAVTGGGIMFVGTMAGAFAPNIAMLALTQGLITGFGGSLALMSFAVFALQHFTTNKAIGAGMAMLGVSVGQTLGPLCIHSLITKFGWRGALLLQSCIVAHLILLGLLFRPPEHQSCTTQRRPITITLSQVQQAFKDMTDVTLFKNGRFCIISVCMFLHFFYNVSFTLHLPAAVVSLKYSKEEAMWMMTLCTVVGMIAKILSSFIANHRRVNMIVYQGVAEFIGVVATVTMVLFRSFVGQAMGAALFGLHDGASNTIHLVVLAGIAGEANTAQAIGLMYMFAAIAAASSSPFLGFLYDVTKSYDVPFTVDAAICFTAAMLAFIVAWLQSRTHKVGNC